MINSRNKILQEIQQANTSIYSKPLAIDVPAITFNNKKEKFVEVLTTIGGNAVEVNNIEEVKTYLQKEIEQSKKVITVLNEEAINLTKDELYKVDVACIKGGVAVAENGTIWITEKNMGNRMLPFSTQQLFIVIEEKNIVNNMHEAYANINSAENGYGVFIAGPSKTADIEQSLVIGAHGPINFIAFIIKSN